MSTSALLLADNIESAEACGLEYVTDTEPGIRRTFKGETAVYVAPDGSEIDDPDDRLRIASLAIPPAWQDVWICPSPAGHIQATGRDARGRKQYRYHPTWRMVRDQAKFDQLMDFGHSLPAIRKQTSDDLARRGLPREKVLAAIVQLLERTRIRVGNDEYARDNGSFGLTTLEDDHACVGSSVVRFTFRGKSGKDHEVSLNDRRLAGVVKRCQDLPGQRLFQYVAEDGELRSVTSDDVNAYLRDITGQRFTAKDYRTWAGSVLAFRYLKELEPPQSATAGKRNVNLAVDRVAAELRNTRAVSRGSYIHPAVLEAYLDGTLRNLPDLPAKPDGWLTPEELGLLALLESAPTAA